jgi:kumamolisin
MKKEKSANAAYIKLEGSAKAAPEGNRVDTLRPDDVFNVTLRIRRKKSIEPVLKAGRRMTHENYEKNFGASEKDIARVERFSHENHLTIVESNKARRSVVLKGTVADFEKAFQTQLAHYRDAQGNTFRGRAGDLHIPAELEAIIEGVFGLDDRPMARPMFKVAKQDGAFVTHAASLQSFTPDQVAAIYGFPKATGKGQCIAIIELGGGYRTADLSAYFTRLGITPPAIKAVSVDGGHNKPSNPNSADGEVMLDIEVAGAVAPGAAVVVYFTPNTDKGFLDAITTAIHDTQNKPSAISISWGSAEKNWTAQSLKSFNEAFKAASLLGVTVCAASGDQGSSDSEHDGKVHVDFPSSSPYVLACGGTRLTLRNGAIASETVWHDSDSSASGGGVSDVFPLPGYQQKTTVPPSLNTGLKGRGVPDVAANADPATGYKVLVDGQEAVIGGTSAAAPLMAAFIARVNQKKAKKAGFIHPALYAKPALCRDITQGNNITTSTHKGYKAGAGWDACTGWGVLSKL